MRLRSLFFEQAFGADRPGTAQYLPVWPLIRDLASNYASAHAAVAGRACGRERLRLFFRNVKSALTRRTRQFLALKRHFLFQA